MSPPTPSSSSTAVIPRKRKHETVSKDETDPTVSVASEDDDDDDDDERDTRELESEVVVEPVLSHAQKRRKKKTVDAPSSNVANPPTAIKRQHSVWVGNLAYKTQQSDLRTFFDGVGGITRINMPTKISVGGPGKKPDNRGFAYVDFETVEAKMAAIALSERPLFGRKLLIKDGASFEGRPAAFGEIAITDPTVAQQTHSKTAQKILRVQKRPAAPTLFFGNLPFETTEDDIRQLLDAHRPRARNKRKDKEEEEEAEERPTKDWIRKVRMGTFEDSGLCKGFAFVDFTSVDNATSALVNPKNHHLNGRTLVVEYASPEAVRRGAAKSAAGHSKAGPAQTRHPAASADDDEKMMVAESEKPPAEMDSEETPKKVSTPPHEHERPPHRDGDWRGPKDKKESSSFLRRRQDAKQQQGFKGRAKPGAALAQAKRQAVGIVPSQGKKIIF